MNNMDELKDDLDDEISFEEDQEQMKKLAKNNKKVLEKAKTAQQVAEKALAKAEHFEHIQKIEKVNDAAKKVTAIKKAKSAIKKLASDSVDSPRKLLGKKPLIDSDSETESEVSETEKFETESEQSESEAEEQEVKESKRMKKAKKIVKEDKDEHYKVVSKSINKLLDQLASIVAADKPKSGTEVLKRYFDDPIEGTKRY